MTPPPPPPPKVYARRCRYFTKNVLKTIKHTNSIIMNYCLLFYEHISFQKRIVNIFYRLSPLSIFVNYHLLLKGHIEVVMDDVCSSNSFEEGRKEEYVFLIKHSTHFIYGYIRHMVKD